MVSVKGLLASVAFVIVATLVLVIPWLLGRGGPAGFAVGAVLSVPTMGGFLLVVRRHSDWRG